jgi:MFS family permease
MVSLEKQDAKSSVWKTLMILSSLGLIVLFDEMMILPAIPDFIREFNISYSTSSWLLSSYIIAAAVMTPIGGRLSDIYGKKKILLIVIGIYIAGVMAGRFATNIEFMLVARAAQGVGMAAFPIAFGIIREIFPEKKLALGQTIFSAMFPAGSVVGLVGGAAIIQNYGWQATFLAVLPVSIVLWLIIARFVRVPRQVPPMEAQAEVGNNNSSNPANRQQTVDIKGTLTLAATIILFLTGITFLESNGAGAWYLIAALFAGSAASLAAFIAIEKRTPSPLLDLKLMKNRNFLPPTIILMLTFLSVFTVYLTVPVMVRSPEPSGFGGDALAVASVQLPFMLVFLIGSVASGFILNRVKNTKLTMIGTAISTIGFFMLLMFHSTETMVSVGLTVLAAGLSLSITGGFNVIIVSVPMQMTGIALGMTLLLNLVGMSVGPVFAGIMQQTYRGPVEGVEGLFPTQDAYNLIFITAAFISLASLALALAVSRRKAAPAIVQEGLPKADEKG